MKIGLTFLTQIQGTPESEQLNASRNDPEQGGRSLGGWVAQTIRQLVSQIETGYHTEHNDNDTHKTITATGSISERSRTTAMGVWIDVPFAATNFTVPSGSTWTVTQGQTIAYQYTLVGTTMVVSFYIESSTLATAASSVLYLAVPANARATRRVSSQFAYDDNGTRGTGIAQVRPVSAASNAGTTIELRKDMRGSTNWSTSAALSIFGEIAFEIVAADTATPVNNTFVATGGVVTTSGLNTIHTFTASGTFTVAQGSATVSYLVVGGGGGGGNSGNSGTAGGGGGGGRVITGSQILTPGTYTVTIGAGGAGAAGNVLSQNGTVGGNSVFNATTATGGGGGGSTASATGGNGGNGGGGHPSATGTEPGGTGTDNNGGAGYNLAVTGGAGGGGSTAGVGGAGGVNDGGAGGAATSNSLSGAAVSYGGGGGGASLLGTGGTGGTNAGSGSSAPSGTGTSGTANRGGGGGGSQNGNGAGLSGSGGSGIVIVSYPTP